MTSAQHGDMSSYWAEKSLAPRSFEEVRALIKAADEAEAARAKPSDKRNDSEDIAEIVKGQGIYMGRYTLSGLSMVFNVYAAPQDLVANWGWKNRNGDRVTRVFTYSEAVKGISLLRNWHGYNGGNYRNENELFQAMRSRRYKGEWVIPPREFLDGKNGAGDIVRSFYNFSDLRDDGAFKNTFEKAAAFSDQKKHVYPDCYWSSTLQPQLEEEGLQFVAIHNGYTGWDRPQSTIMNRCRPVRFVPVFTPGMLA